MIVCVGVGLDPQISWRQNGVAITNGSDDRVTVYNRLSEQNNINFIESILEICSAQSSDEGDYSCTVSSRTLMNSLNFTVSVNITPAAVIVAPSDTYAIFNSSVFLTCAASGYPLPTITWYKEGERVDDTDDIQTQEVSQERFVKSTLVLCSVQETATYNCSASNGISGGEVTSVTATVFVQGK